MIEKILIANRGEIACRIIRTCRELGIATVAVYSDADVNGRHVQLAHEAIHIGPAPAAESYLVGEKLIAAAQQAGADAIHPGYGFLAENAAFARACSDAGLIFIGPRAEAIEAMGNKRAARHRMAAAGIPTVPGYDGADQQDETLTAVAHDIGFPIMVKAAAGGGGKGMRLVASGSELPDALAAARREALQAFGSDELLLERALRRPRHIEVQIFGDEQGNLIHLGERECSIQRRHQKVIEESPAVGLPPALRQRICETAVAAGQTLNYSNAGTVEFLLAEDGSFYFLEINTRIQVEHPVTELVTGQDLVAWQIRVAEGEALPLTQEQVTRSGHAIEVRLYAENPANDFLPVTGDVALWRPPKLPHIRVDSGLLPQDRISVYYDPMIAKMIAHGPDRKTAVRRLRHALDQTNLLGLTTNLPYLQAILAHDAFVAGDLHTGFLSEQLPAWQPALPDPTWFLAAASLAQYRTQQPDGSHYWRNSPNRPPLYRYANQPDVQLTPHAEGFALQIGEEGVTAVIHNDRPPDLTFSLNGHRRRATLLPSANGWWVQVGAETLHLETVSLLPQPKAAAAAGGSLRAPMPGLVLAVLVSEGERVHSGQPLLKLEAMKMEHTIRSGADGVVTAVYFTAGEQVEADAQLLHIEPA